MKEPDDQKRLDDVKQITGYFQTQAFTNPISRRVPLMVEGPGISGAEFNVSGAMSFANVVAKQ
jgi:hypothetical protein